MRETWQVWKHDKRRTIVKLNMHVIAIVSGLQDQISLNDGIRMRSGLIQHECIWLNNSSIAVLLSCTSV